MFAPELDRAAHAPLYQQLYLAIRRMITAGELKNGEKLPSKRNLAARLGVSVLTVERAYEQLSDEGYLTPRRGSGFYAEDLQIPRQPAERPAPEKELPEAPPETYRYDYTTSGTDLGSFPFSVWQKLSREVLSGEAEKLLSPCPAAGTRELREAIASYLGSFRGINVSPRQIVVGAGSEYLAGLAIRLLGRDKLYGIENPGYPKIAKIFAENGVEVLPLPLDGQGLVLPSDGKVPDVLHLTPAHHFPTGVIMPAGRRSELLCAMSKKDGFILEDDYDSEFRMKGQIPPSLFEIDGGGRVVCIGTFAKLLAPSLRISYMILPPDLLPEYEKRLTFYACTVPVFEQLTLALFIRRGYFERHINRMNRIYRGRRSAVIAAFSALFDLGASVGGGDAGLHLLVSLKNCSFDEETLVRRAKDAGVRLSGLRSYYFPGTPEKELPDCPCLVLGFTAITEEKIKESAALLQKAWR